MSNEPGNMSNKDMAEILRDMGFADWEPVPGWAYDLAERLIDSGWKKK